MMNARTLFAAATVTLAVMGCSSPEDKMREAEQARIEADKKVAQATQDANQKAAEIQKKAADDTARVALEGAKKIDAADSAANQKVADATDAFLKARADVQSAAAKKLESLDKDVIDLRAKLEKKVSKTEADKVIADLKAKSEAVRKSNEADLASSTAASFDLVKKTIDARLSDLDQAIADVKKRV
jgi:hypothetical protein